MNEARIIIITQCAECPHCYKIANWRHCKLTYESCPDERIPEWCPLEKEGTDEAE